MNDQQVMHAMSIDDSYHLERTLASGVGGVTELVTLDGSGPFVRKRIPSKLARRGVWATIAECGCARLPRVEATYEMPDEFVVVCDYVPGENLEDRVRSLGRMGEDEAREVVGQLCEAASALHARGIVHRDISPSNVVLAADGAHLIDLGIARFRVDGASHDTTQLGTPGFASPEQHGFAQTDERSDVYSLGRVLGYLLTGVMPEVPDAAEYERALADEQVVSPRMRAIVERACALEPSARYQSAAELAQALRAEKDDVAGLTDGSQRPGASAPTEAAGETSARPARRTRAVALFALAAVVVVAACLGVFLLLSSAFGQGGPSGGATGDDAQLVGRDPADDVPATTGPGQDPAAGDAPATGEARVEVVESGWSVDEQGFVHYAVELRNPGDASVEFPAFTVTGRDDAGSVVFSEEQVLSCVGPGGTVWWGGQAGGPGQAPATVEFSPSDVADYQVGSAGADVATFSVDGVRAIPDDLGGVSFVGEVTCEKDDGSDFGGQVALSVVLRDASGAIVYGDTDFVARPAPGETASFELSCYDVPDYASFEVHALAW